MTESMNADKAKREAKERDGWECRFCGMTNEEHTEQYDRGLHAHHIVKDADDGIDHPRNLITVCRDCHKTLENTQADALRRIRNEHTERLQKEVEQQEAHIQEMESALQDTRFNPKHFWGLVERVHALEREVATLRAYADVFDTALGELERMKVTAYVVHETRFNTSRLLYVGTDQEKAYEAFQESENHATMESATLSTDEDDLADALPDDVREQLDRIESAASTAEERTGTLERKVDELGGR